MLFWWNLCCYKLKKGYNYCPPPHFLNNGWAPDSIYSLHTINILYNVQIKTYYFVLTICRCNCVYILYIKVFIYACRSGDNSIKQLSSCDGCIGGDVRICITLFNGNMWLAINNCYESLLTIWPTASKKHQTWLHCVMTSSLGESHQCWGSTDCLLTCTDDFLQLQ